MEKKNNGIEIIDLLLILTISMLVGVTAIAMSGLFIGLFLTVTINSYLLIVTINNMLLKRHSDKLQDKLDKRIKRRAK